MTPRFVVWRSIGLNCGAWLPPLLAAPADLPRTAAGMFTVSYATAIVIPTVSGALWDATGTPWAVFVPLCLCALVLSTLGGALARYRPAGEKLLPR